MHPWRGSAPLRRADAIVVDAVGNGAEQRRVAGDGTLAGILCAFVVAGFAAGFLFELDGTNDDGFVEGLASCRRRLGQRWKQR